MESPTSDHPATRCTLSECEQLAQLITGAGAVYANRLAKGGYDLLVVARNEA